MKIIEVTSKKEWGLFHQVLKTVYAKDANYIYPLENEIEKVFNPQENKTFDDGEAICFVMVDERNRPIGRIAAFIDHPRSRKAAHPLGGIGFFESIANRDCAFQLFEKAENWLLARKIELIDGPINFGERDRFWGLLVKGHYPPLYQENYHPPYYESFFLEWGFQPFEQILTYKGFCADIPFKRLAAVAARLQARQPVTVKPIDYKKLSEFAKDFSTVYNASFDQFPHFKPITPDQVQQIMEQARPIADPDLACIAYYDGHPAGFIVLYPDINPFLKHAKGKLNILTTPLFLLKNRLAKTKNAKGMGFGIHPEYQSKGIFALLVDYLASDRILRTYPYMYLAGIRTHNHEIRSMYAKLQVEVDRIHVMYRKALNPAIKIEPFEFLTEES